MPKKKGAKGTTVTLKMAKKALRTTIDGGRRLTLANMGIVVFPKCILKLGNINELDLSRNQIAKIPNYIGNLQSLKVLDLHSNRLETCPEEMGNLESLEYLNLSNNCIKILPSTVGSLTNLKFFNIGMNNLDSLPETMDKLQNLEELGLFDNQFKTVPNFLNDLHSLKKLNLKRNPVWYSQRDRASKSERTPVYLVHENSLCKKCRKKCQQHQLKYVTQGGENKAKEQESDEEESLNAKYSRSFTGMITPNSVAKVYQNAWRIRKV